MTTYPQYTLKSKVNSGKSFTKTASASTGMLELFQSASFDEGI